MQFRLSFGLWRIPINENVSAFSLWARSYFHYIFRSNTHHTDAFPENRTRLSACRSFFLEEFFTASLFSLRTFVLFWSLFYGSSQKTIIKPCDLSPKFSSHPTDWKYSSKASYTHRIEKFSIINLFFLPLPPSLPHPFPRYPSDGWWSSTTTLRHGDL